MEITMPILQEKDKVGIEANKNYKVLKTLLAYAASDLIKSAGNATLFTNNTGGTAGTAIIATPQPSATGYTVVGSGAAQKTSFDAVLAAHNNGCSVIVDHINTFLALLNISQLTEGNGTIATPATVPAAAASVTGADGTSNSAVEKVTALDRLNKLRNNVVTAAFAVNKLANALNKAPLAIVSTGDIAPAGLVSISATATGVDGTALSTLSKADVDAYFAASRINLSTIVAAANVLLDPYKSGGTGLVPELDLLG
jgi:hypothetical protein